jgi:hypothetical protein
MACQQRPGALSQLVSGNRLREPGIVAWWEVGVRGLRTHTLNSPSCPRAILPPSGGNAAGSTSPARRSGRNRQHRWCAPVGRSRSRYASAGTRCAMGEAGAPAWHSRGIGWHSPQPALRPQYRLSRRYIRSNSVPCFSIVTITDSSADCCVSFEDRAVAALGRSVCRRLV